MKKGSAINIAKDSIKLGKIITNIAESVKSQPKMWQMNMTLPLRKLSWYYRTINREVKTQFEYYSFGKQ